MTDGPSKVEMVRPDECLEIVGSRKGGRSKGREGLVVGEGRGGSCWEGDSLERRIKR